ncbi:hypothetical protein [Microvirga roseola]|uniref:hypothetical protein n=1 Tax=Microvirga roseola TaxID=2883126 RepID=UPI001E429F13|nr:hypothetical protein [Microvirga roseola]
MAQASDKVSFSNGLAVGSKISVFLAGYGLTEVGEVDAASTQNNVIIKFAPSASIHGVGEIVGA